MVKGTNNQIVINSLLSISDVYFLPSPSEGFPLVFIEAMSAGLPWSQLLLEAFQLYLEDMKMAVILSEWF